jgi:hypothetical protein
MPEYCEQYIEQGFAIIPNLFDWEKISRLKKEVQTLFLSATQSCYTDHAVSDLDFNDLLHNLFEKNYPAYLGAAKAANHLASFHALSHTPALMDVLKNLRIHLPLVCARPLMWFHMQALAKSERYFRLPAHQEWSNMQGSLDGAVVWSPLVDIHREMGQLEILPGSHRAGLLPYATDEKKDPYPFAILPEHIDEKSFVAIDVPVCGALIFSPFLVHRSGINQTNNIRWTFNFRYNNGADISFIQRNFANPFEYHASPKIIDGFWPSAKQVRHV